MAVALLAGRWCFWRLLVVDVKSCGLGTPSKGRGIRQQVPPPFPLAVTVVGRDSYVFRFPNNIGISDLEHFDVLGDRAQLCFKSYVVHGYCLSRG